MARGVHEQAQKIKARVRSATVHPATVMSVATSIMGLSLAIVIPRFKEGFSGLTGGAPLPAFTTVVLNISDFAKHHFVTVLLSCLRGRE